MTPTERRLQLRAAGFAPLPLTGKAPPILGWPEKADASEDEIRTWACRYSNAPNTGIITKATPAFDIDILNQLAAEDVERLLRETFDKRGRILLRIGRAPKRAILLRTDNPFSKIEAKFAGGEKVELLAAGQQLAAFGVHPDTQKPYCWHGGEPGAVRREELPPITELEARQLVEDAATLLVKNYSYVRTGVPKDKHSTLPQGWRPNDRHLASLGGLIRTVARASAGQRNSTIYWASCRAGEMVVAGLIGKSEAVEILVESAARCGLPRDEAHRTVLSGLKRTGAANA